MLILALMGLYGNPIASCWEISKIERAVHHRHKRFVQIVLPLPSEG